MASLAPESRIPNPHARTGHLLRRNVSCVDAWSLTFFLWFIIMNRTPYFFLNFFLFFFLVGGEGWLYTICKLMVRVKSLLSSAPRAALQCSGSGRWWAGRLTQTQHSWTEDSKLHIHPGGPKVTLPNMAPAQQKRGRPSDLPPATPRKPTVWCFDLTRCLCADMQRR